MSVSAHIEQLAQKHATLERALENENSRPHPNESVIAQLKREKLKIKDEMERLRRPTH